MKQLCISFVIMNYFVNFLNHVFKLKKVRRLTILENKKCVSFCNVCYVNSLIYLHAGPMLQLQTVNFHLIHVHIIYDYIYTIFILPYNYHSILLLRTHNTLCSNVMFTDYSLSSKGLGTSFFRFFGVNNFHQKYFETKSFWGNCQTVVIILLFLFLLVLFRL